MKYSGKKYSGISQIDSQKPWQILLITYYV